MLRIDLIELKTYSNLACIKKTRGTHLHLVSCTRISPPSLALNKLRPRLVIRSQDLMMRECTPEVNSAVFGITSLQTRHLDPPLRSFRKISFSAPLAKKDPMVYTITHHELNVMLGNRFCQNTPETASWTILDQKFMFLTIAEFISWFSFSLNSILNL